MSCRPKGTRSRASTGERASAHNRLASRHVFGPKRPALCSRIHFSSLTLPQRAAYSYTLIQSTKVTKKSDDSLVGQRQCFIVVQQLYGIPNVPHVWTPVPDPRTRVEVELERVRSGRLGGLPPQLADHGEAVAGLDALHVGEHHGRDVQAGIEDRLPRIGCRHVARGRNGDVARVRVSESWLSVVAFLGVAF